MLTYSHAHSPAAPCWHVVIHPRRMDNMLNLICMVLNAVCVCVSRRRNG